MDGAGDPERTTVANAGQGEVRIESIGSLDDPFSDEPFAVDVVLGPGEVATFESGDAAGGPNALTRRNIYDNEAPDEGACFRTSAGMFRACCTA